MPELPEVERARRLVEKAAVGHRIARIRALHRAHARRLSKSRATSARGRVIERVERYGKHQLLRLSGGWMAHVHFRMSGDWEIGSTATAPSPHARLLMDLADGTRLSLVDPRALSTFTLHPPGVDPLPRLGPDPLSADFDTNWLAGALRGRRVSIKVALLDQRVAAGVGNIYAAEALWVARIDPRAITGTLRRTRLARLAEAIRQLLRAASSARGHGTRDEFVVYGREGEPCLRCRARIRRIVQAGRSTYFCPRCQRR